MILGIDVGGTNIDGVLIRGKEIYKSSKMAVNQENLLASVEKTLSTLLKGLKPKEIRRVNLSTTISTNAIVQNNIPKVGLIVQKGPGINYDFSKITDYYREISGYVDHRGKEVAPISEEEVKQAIGDFIDLGIDYLAIVSKFSPRSKEAEEKVYKLAKPYFKYISLGHRLSGRLNFPRRVNSTVLNSGVSEVFFKFAQDLELGLENMGISCPLNILKADGGTFTIEEAKEKAIETVLSGPAASFMGMEALIKHHDDALLMDIGGTTTDMFFVANGSPLFQRDGAEIAGHKTLARALFSKSIGLGGDSFVRVEDGELKIGPKRLGKPMGFGGSFPTLTDAFISLGRITQADQEASKRALEDLAKVQGLSLDEIARDIVRKFVGNLKVKFEETLLEINSKTLYTVKEILERENYRPKEIILIGGPASLLKDYIEEAFGIKTSLPENFHIANAIGAALAIPSAELNLLGDTGRGLMTIAELGIEEKIPRDFNLDMGKNIVLNYLEKSGYEGEIVEEESFNMVEGYSFKKNIRIKGQLKPGLDFALGGGNVES